MIHRNIEDKGPRIMEVNEKHLPLDSQISINVIYEGRDPVRIDLTGAKNCDMSEYPKAIHALEKLAAADQRNTAVSNWCRLLIAGLRRIETWRDQACGAPFQLG